MNSRAHSSPRWESRARHKAAESACIWQTDPFSVSGNCVLLILNSREPHDKLQAPTTWITPNAFNSVWIIAVTARWGRQSSALHIWFCISLLEKDKSFKVKTSNLKRQYSVSELKISRKHHKQLGENTHSETRLTHHSKGIRHRELVTVAFQLSISHWACVSVKSKYLTRGKNESRNGWRWHFYI